MAEIMTVTVKMTEIEIFQDLLKIAKDFTDDERIEESIRSGYAERVLALCNQCKQDG